jgi:hypothetical protein
MQTDNNPRSCGACGKLLRGRSDKKFCDDQCRNQFNNQVRAADSGFMRSVNTTLRKNRKILQQCIPPEKMKTSIRREKLVQKGFHFAYNTHHVTNRAGLTYKFCYEYGYLAIDADKLVLIRDRMDGSGSLPIP